MPSKEFISASEWAGKHGISPRTARNYCHQGKIAGAILIGKTWNIPAEAPCPGHKRQSLTSPLLERLRQERDSSIKGGIYHRVQIDLTYNSNHIEGSRLSKDQTRYIFETNTVGISDEAMSVDDIIETANHFRAVDYIIDTTDEKLTEAYIKQLHLLLKSGTSASRKAWFATGDYKKLPNEVGGNDTVAPEEVHSEMQALLRWYNDLSKPAFDDILDFHHRFESIHPFQDGNGRVGRLIMFRECLRNNIVPFIITDELKMFYYNGLKNWPRIKGYLTDTCLTAQDSFKLVLDKFHIEY